MKTKNFFLVAFVAALSLVSFGAQAAGIDVQALLSSHANVLAGLSMMGAGTIESVMKALDGVDAKITAMATKAEGEMATLGKVSTDTKTAIDAIGVEQRVLADRLLLVEQKSTAQADTAAADESYGAQFTKNAEYASFQKKTSRGSIGLELKNTVTNAIGSTYSERRPGIVENAFREFTIEQLLTSIPTSSNAIDWVRENVFTNAAAETAEGLQIPQSAITFTTGTMPVQNVAHFIKITRQLAQDNASLAAFINRRMVYGVNFRVESQLVAGTGVAPNIEGITKAGNFTAHGYTAAALTALGLSPTNKLDLIGKMIGDCALADYPADVVIMNTGDWWNLRLSKDTQGRYLLGDPASAVAPTLFGRPVVASNAMTALNVWVGSLSQAMTLHNREGIVVDLSDSDENNFQLGLVSIRAMRRLALTVEKPAAARYGLLTPA
ncbi:MAG: phage major capsid protein [Polaromonas sp.]|nr:phage major capsid protein [Polaromonas sp.]